MEETGCLTRWKWLIKYHLKVNRLLNIKKHTNGKDDSELYLYYYNWVKNMCIRK